MKDEPPKSGGYATVSQCATGEEWRNSSTQYTTLNTLQEKSGEIAPERRKRLSQSRNNTQWRMCLVVRVKYNAKKNNIA